MLFFYLFCDCVIYIKIFYILKLFKINYFLYILLLSYKVNEIILVSLKLFLYESKLVYGYIYIFII